MLQLEPVTHTVKLLRVSGSTRLETRRGSTGNPACVRRYRTLFFAILWHMAHTQPQRHSAGLAGLTRTPTGAILRIERGGGSQRVLLGLVQCFGDGEVQ